MNPFFSISSSGGYFGRWAWTNSHRHFAMPEWGQCVWFHCWAGQIPVVRLLTHLR